MSVSSIDSTVVLGNFLAGSRKKLLNRFIGSTDDGVREERDIACKENDQMNIEKSSERLRERNKSHLP